MGFTSVEGSGAVASAKKSRLCSDWIQAENRNEPDENSADAMLGALREASQVYMEETKADEVELPEWFDQERYKRGAETFERNIFSMMSGKMSGLLSLLAVPSIVKVLVLTGKSSESDTAFRRYIDTTRHMLFWYRSNITHSESSARQSLRAVRAHHFRSSAAAQRSGLGRFTQLDLALTQFAFCGFAVLRRTVLGVNASDQDLLDFLHVWRTIGHFIGMKNRFNVCRFDNDLALTDKVFEGICTKWIGPALTSPPEEFDSMARPLISGLWCMMPLLEHESYISFTQELAGVAEADRICPSSRYGSILLWLLHLVPNSMTWPIIGAFSRAYHNVNMRFSIYMSTYYPLLAWFSFPGNSNSKYRKLVPNER